jgi:hypothetical protein
MAALIQPIPTLLSQVTAAWPGFRESALGTPPDEGPAHLYPSPVPPADPDADARARFVQPFYLKMMRLNAIRYGARLAAEVARAGRNASPSDVVALLRSAWRERVMGAWFALLHDDQLVVEALLRALSTSHGSLDAPPLATAAVILAGAHALPALETYYVADVSNEWGAAGIAAAAVDHLRRAHHVDSDIPTPGEDEAQWFSELIAVAEALRHQP